MGLLDPGPGFLLKWQAILPLASCMPWKSVLIQVLAKRASRGIPDTAQPAIYGCFPVGEVLDDSTDTLRCLF
jgi:hypothetical protein